MNIVNNVLKHIKLPFKLRELQVKTINDYGKYHRHGLYLDMGLGKTVCATIIGVQRLLDGVHTCLILCPPVILKQWRDWLESLDLSVILYEGDIKDRADIRKKTKMYADFCLMSPNIFRNDFKSLREIWNGEEIHLVIDEANLIKKHTGKTHRKVKLLQGEEGGITLLTGTPLTSPQDAYGYVKLITPIVYRTKGQFDRVHVARKDKYNNAVEYDNLPLLKENFYLQSIRIEVDEMLDMPDIDYQFIEYELDPEHLRLYKKLIKEKLMVIQKTNKIINATKAQAMRHWAQRLVFAPEHLGYEGVVNGAELALVEAEQSDHVAIFSNYVDTNAKLCEVIPESGGVYGKITKKNRDQNIKDFQDGKLKRLIINPRSGGVGLELQGSCNHVLFCEFPITGNEFRQARSRVWRQKQEKKVICKMLVAKKTVQESLIRAIFDKDDILAQVQPTIQTLREELLVDV